MVRLPFRLKLLTGGSIRGTDAVDRSQRLRREWTAIDLMRARVLPYALHRALPRSRHVKDNAGANAAWPRATREPIYTTSRKLGDMEGDGMKAN